MNVDHAAIGDEPPAQRATRAVGAEREQCAEKRREQKPNSGQVCRTKPAVRARSGRVHPCGSPRARLAETVATGRSSASVCAVRSKILTAPTAVRRARFSRKRANGALPGARLRAVLIGPRLRIARRNGMRQECREGRSAAAHGCARSTRARGNANSRHRPRRERRRPANLRRRGNECRRANDEGSKNRRPSRSAARASCRLLSSPRACAARRDRPARPLATYLPELRDSAYGQTVLCEHLLSHTSGYRGTSIFDSRMRAFSWDGLVAYLKSAPQLFAPGTVFSYEHTESVLLVKSSGASAAQRVRWTRTAAFDGMSAGRHVFDERTGRFVALDAAEPIPPFWQPASRSAP